MQCDSFHPDFHTDAFSPHFFLIHTAEMLQIAMWIAWLWSLSQRFGASSTLYRFFFIAKCIEKNGIDFNSVIQCTVSNEIAVFMGERERERRAVGYSCLSAELWNLGIASLFFPIQLEHDFLLEALVFPQC